MLEIIFTALVYLAGAITEYESKGKVTEVFYYADKNATICKCKDEGL